MVSAIGNTAIRGKATNPLAMIMTVAYLRIREGICGWKGGRGRGKGNDLVKSISARFGDHVRFFEVFQNTKYVPKEE